MSTSPPQPQQWYRVDWPSTPAYILESRLERWEVYNQNFRQWHWRIGMEMIGFTFSALATVMNVPMQLMVGANDDYPYVHFAQYVPTFATQSLHKPDRALTVPDTGHSIHNERPVFLANQIVSFPVHSN
jgi:pimeloyl-ACP methyl ester carboxylesterase